MATRKRSKWLSPEYAEESEFLAALRALTPEERVETVMYWLEKLTPEGQALPSVELLQASVWGAKSWQLSVLLFGENSPQEKEMSCRVNEGWNKRFGYENQVALHKARTERLVELIAEDAEGTKK